MPSRVQGYRVANEKQQTIENLVGFYNDRDFAFGTALRDKLSISEQTPITAEHISVYYAQLDDFGDEHSSIAGERIISAEMLHRALRTLQIEILLRKADAADVVDIIKRQIKKKFAEKLDALDATVLESHNIDDVVAKTNEFLATNEKLIVFLEARTTLGETFDTVKDLPVILSNTEINVLYDKIYTALKQQRKPATEAAVEYVTTQRKIDKPKNMVEEVIEHGLSLLAQPYKDQTDKAYKNDNLNKPERRLEELDFGKHNVVHKELLMAKLLVLQKQNIVDFHRFNKIIRKWLLNTGSTPAEQNKLNAKIKFALGKLIIVLRNHGLEQDADAIELQVFDTANKHVAKYTKFKKESEDATGQSKDKIKSALSGIQDFLKKLWSRSDLPADVKALINPEKDGRRIIQFAQKIAEYPESGAASRKLMNKCHGLARALNAIANEDMAAAELQTTGATFAADEDVVKISPRLELFEAFKTKYNELKERITLSDKVSSMQGTPAKLYFSEPELITNRIKQKDELYAQVKQAEIKLNAKVTALVERLNNITTGAATYEPDKAMQLEEKHIAAGDVLVIVNNMLTELENVVNLTGLAQLKALEKVATDFKTAQPLINEMLATDKPVKASVTPPPQRHPDFSL